MAIDDPIFALERQLVDAARRRSAPRRRIGGGVVALVAATLVALAVAAAALTLPGGRPHPVPVPPAAPAAHDQLVELLGVLRDPQTKVDLTALPGIRPRTARAQVVVSDRHLARLAALAPWGQRIYLVPFAGAGVDRVAILVHGALWRAANAAKIIDGRALLYVRSAGRPRPLRLIQVVPDGVARVSLLFAAGALIETVRVHRNTAAFQVVPRPTGRLALLWFNRAGHALKRVTLP